MCFLFNFRTIDGQKDKERMAYFEDEFKSNYGIVTHPQGIEFSESPNHSGQFDPKYLVLHYTGGPSLESAINWFNQSRSQVSAHFTIDWDGRIVQSVRTSRTAWHAGVSNYAGLSGLNRHSIGIELVNYGHMDILPGGRYRTYFGKIVEEGDKVETSSGEEFSVEIVEAVHPIMGGQKKAWVMATPEQVESVISLGRWLMDEYDLKECLTHEEISRGRKWDTGPTITSSVISKIEGSRTADSEKKIDKNVKRVSANGSLNLRYGPGMNEPVIALIPNGDLVTVLESPDGKSFVKVVTHKNSMEGWVHKGFLVEA
jgi:N-acetylmuramoyl-L-alanine amidase